MYSYPSEILPSFAYLGCWEHAEDNSVLEDLKIKAVLTIHNNPENLKLPADTTHLRLTLADVDSENIAQYFEESFQFFEKCREEKRRVLVHCGAGVSRSATLLIAYVMRRHGLTRQGALQFCQKRRSVTLPNDGNQGPRECVHVCVWEGVSMQVGRWVRM